MTSCFSLLEPFDPPPYKKLEDYDRMEVGFACCRCRQVTTINQIVSQMNYDNDMWICVHCNHTRCEIPDKKS